MICTSEASSIATQPAVGPPSVVWKKNAAPLPGAWLGLTPITTACLYCGISRFSLAEVSNGHCAWWQTCIVLKVGLLSSPFHQWLGPTCTYFSPPPGLGAVPNANGKAKTPIGVGGYPLWACGASPADPTCAG